MIKLVYMKNFPYLYDDPRWYVVYDGTKVGLFSLRKHMCWTTVCPLCRLCISPPNRRLRWIWYPTFISRDSVSCKLLQVSLMTHSRHSGHDNQELSVSVIIITSTGLCMFHHFLSRCMSARLSNQIFSFPCFHNHQPLPILTRLTGLAVEKLAPA